MGEYTTKNKYKKNSLNGDIYLLNNEDQLYLQLPGFAQFTLACFINYDSEFLRLGNRFCSVNDWVSSVCFEA